MEVVFFNKEALWIGLAIFVLAAFYIFSFRKNYVEVFFITLIGILISFLLANPSLKKGYKVLYKEDTEIAILLDHSLSMAVNDIKPNRFEAGRKKILKLLDRLNGLKTGVVVFADKSQIVLYPEENAQKLKETIKSLNLPLKGSTNLLEGLSMANSILSGKEKIIILISDGGDEDLNKIFQLASKMSSRIIFYGIGTKEGGFVPGYKALSKLNTEASKLSQITRGISVFYTKSDEDIEKISSFIKNIAQKTKKEVLKIPNYLYLSPFIAVGILGIIFLRFLVKKAFLILLVFPFVSYGGEVSGYFFYMIGKYEKAGKEFLEEKDPQNKYNAGVSFIKGGFYDKALNILKEIKTDDLELKKKADYNIAYIYVVKREYTKAHSILEKLYQLYPNDKKIEKLYLFTNMVVNLNQKNKRKETVVKIKEEKPKQNPKTQGEVGTKNPW